MAPNPIIPKFSFSFNEPEEEAILEDSESESESETDTGSDSSNEQEWISVGNGCEIRPGFLPIHFELNFANGMRRSFHLPPLGLEELLIYPHFSHPDAIVDVNSMRIFFQIHFRQNGLFLPQKRIELLLQLVFEL